MNKRHVPYTAATVFAALATASTLAENAMVAATNAPLFGDGVAFDTALSWCSRPGSFPCPEAYSNDTFRYVADRVAETGVRHIRERIAWKQVAPEPNAWSPGHYRANAELWAERGIRMSDMFHDAPDYARKGERLPRDPVATFNFCRRLAEEFGDTAEMWEIWNEVDVGFTREGAWESAATMKAASLGFRAGGFRGIVAPGSFARVDRIRHDDVLYENGLADYVDVMNVHTYKTPGDYRGLFADLRGFMERHGIADRAIVLTECGTYQEGLAADEETLPDGRTGKTLSALQEKVQEEFVVKSQILSRMEGVMRNYFFAFALIHERHGQKDWGLLRRDGSVRPAASAFAELVKEVGEGSLLGEVDVPGGLVRAFLFRMPDGSSKLVHWRRTELDDPNGGEVASWDDDPVRGEIVLENGDSFAFQSRRRAGYAALPAGATVAIPARPVGSAARAEAPGKDLAVVMRADLPTAECRLGGNKSRIDIVGDSIHLALEVWNLDAFEKHGRVIFTGRGSVEGLPDEVALPPRGCVTIPVAYRPGKEEDPIIAFGGEFGGLAISPFVMPVFSLAPFARSCDVEECRIGDLARWTRNTTASGYLCEWDEEEKAVRFQFDWKEGDPKDRWLFPRYSLDLPRERLDKAVLLTYEVKSAQDKVENDWKSGIVWFRRDGRVTHYDEAPPLDGWETRYVDIDARLRRMAPDRVEFGGHPLGTSATFWIRNVRIYSPTQGEDHNED